MTTLILIVMILIVAVVAHLSDRDSAQEIDKLKLRVWLIEHPNESANGRHGPEGREW